MELVKLQFLGTPEDLQEYSEADKSLLTTNYINSAFGNTQDYIEYFVYNANNEIIGLSYNVDTFKTGPDVDPTTNTFSSLYLDPLGDLKKELIDRGTYTISYNFLRNQLRSAPGFEFWIKEISATRTEIKVARQDLSNADLAAAFDVFSGELLSNGYYPDFYLNFAQNRLVIAVNAVYVEENGVGYIIFKLYEPLPFDFTLKSRFWVVTKVAEPVEYQIDIQVEAEEVDTTTKLRGPNYNIDIKQEVGATTPYYNYTSLFSTAVPTSLQQIKSLLDEKAVRINVDYSDFKNFIHFSSATERINNFVYKIGLIELYQSSSAAFDNLTPGSNTNYLVSQSKAALQTNINNIITKFDPYEYYLYFTSESTAWPKSSDLYPYTLYSITSSEAINWLGSADIAPTATTMSMLYSASLYDELNSNSLRYTTPIYIREDEENQPYLTFMDMVGQHFDNIWLYYKDVTNRFAAQNNPNKGISLDLVGDALRGLGVTLYTNTNMSDNIYYSLFGINETGSILPVTSSGYAQVVVESSSLYPKAGDDYLSASIYLPPFGNEKINKYVIPLQTLSGGVTSSFQSISPNDLEGEIYKRLYHNLPYILKAKGTERGIKALIACFGIPNTTLSVQEFGGYNMFTRPEIQGIEDLKVYTGSVQLISGNTLSPYVTIEDYNNNTQKNSFDVQVGFSPADSINAHITGTLPNLSVQQLIGNPTLQYSSSYGPLVEVSDDYFNTYYSSRYNVWDFIRVIKYYNNALFKMIQDYVPARSNLMTGIIVKSHILERNKYARHEPVVATSSYGQTIDMISISASDAPQIKYSTAYTSYTMTPSGSIPIQNIYSFEKYTGEFSGSRIEVTNGEAFDQSDYSISVTSGSIIGRINYGALFQNISGSVKSTRFLDLDYSTNQIVPVNYGLITKSIDEGQAALEDPYAPFAQLQDYNYFLRRSTLPRYEGSKVSSLKYNVYTGPTGSYMGDSSYGLSAAIDRNSIKVGWVNNIPEENLNFYTKTTIYLKYLTDLDNQLIELNRSNNNLFDVQNIFKSGTPVVLSISDVTSPSFQKDLDGEKMIFRGGFSYDPILYREDNENLKFEHEVPISQSIQNYSIRTCTENAYRYYAGDTADRTGDQALTSPNSSPDNTSVSSTSERGGSTYTFDIPNTGEYLVGIKAADRFDKTQFNSILSSWGQASNQAVNWTFAPGSANTQRGPRNDCYRFDFLEFPVVTDLNYNLLASDLLVDSVTPTSIGRTRKLFKAPKTSTYKFDGRMRLILITNDARLPGGMSFKLYMTLESSTNPNLDSWNFVKAFGLTPVGSTPGITYYGATNTIKFDQASRYTKFTVPIDATHACTAGTYYRFNLYLLTQDNIFGWNGNNERPGVIEFGFQVGSTKAEDSSTVLPVTEKSFVNIQDTLSTFTKYDYTSSYNQDPSLFLTGSTTSQGSLANRTLVFSPSSSYLFETGSLFTPAPADPFNQSITYYTPVIDNLGVQKYDLIRLGKFKDLNASYYEVVDVQISGSQKQRVVTLNTPVTSSYANIASSFAILRPKPDETSVIVDYRKRPGIVSPTILIPSDLNKEIKDNVGNIFKNLNPNLQ